MLTLEKKKSNKNYITLLFKNNKTNGKNFIFKASRQKLLLITLSLLLLNIQIGAAQISTKWTTSFPVVSSFSSPKVADLNQDGVKDIIIGASRENIYSIDGIIALNGKNGNILWSKPARNQIYGSPIFQDINGDGISDVFIGGRDAQLLALDGTNGTILWEFFPDILGNARDSGWYNFYLPQWIPDQNGDGFQDLIITNGGDATALTTDTIRPAGYLMVISGKNGQILQIDTMPDGKETYHSPLVVDFMNNGQLTVLFGSGGETIGGSYFSVDLNDFMNNGLQNATTLLSDTSKGYVAVPSLVDLNNDNVVDIVVPQLNSSLIVLDGVTKNIMWRYDNLGTEFYTSPTIGQFTGDATPDIFVIYYIGNWPFYQLTLRALIDGSTGQTVSVQHSQTYQMTGGVALDWDNDGFDEILFAKNYDTGFTTTHFKNRFQLHDFNDNTITNIGNERDGVNLFSMPLIVDLDNDQSLDLVFANNDNISHWYQPKGLTIHTWDLGFYRNQIAWSGYLGTASNGTYSPNYNVNIRFASPDFNLKVYPNPTRDRIHFETDNHKLWESITLFDAQGKMLKRVRNTNNILLEYYPSGIYFYKIEDKLGIATGKIIKYD